MHDDDQHVKLTQCVCVFLPYRLFLTPRPRLWAGGTWTSVTAHVVDLCWKKKEEEEENELCSLPLAELCVLITSKGEGYRVGGGSRHQRPQLSQHSGLCFFAAVACCSITHSSSYLHLAFLFLTSSLTSKNTFTVLIQNPERTVTSQCGTLSPSKSRLKSHDFFFNLMKFSHQQSVCPAKTNRKKINKGD